MGVTGNELTESITDPNCDDSGWTDPAFPDDDEIADMGLFTVQA